MVFPILGANTESALHNIDNSCRFNDGDTPYLSFTPSSAVTAERREFTISCWVKRSTLSTVQYIWEMGGVDNVYDRFFLRFQADNTLRLATSGAVPINTTRVFRDLSAWYHIVVAVDTTSTETVPGAVRMYVNGSEITVGSFTNVSLNHTFGFSDDSTHTIGYSDVDNTSPFDGYISELAAVIGQQLPTAFGKFDSDTGIWIPKNFGGDYGTNGFKLEFKQSGTGTNASGIGADTSGNDNHFSVNGITALDQTTDTPTNNFATFNPLIPSTNTYSEGNTLVSMDASADSKTTSTIGVSKGKWYMEFLRNDNDNWPVGIAGSNIEGGYIGGSSTDSLSFWVGLASATASHTELFVNGSEVNDPWNATTWAEGDVVALLLNADDEEISLYKNNSIVGSAYDYSGLNWSQVFFALGNYISGNSYKTNFGNPCYALSSGNADANGYGNFEYAPPSGYYALCTKNLAEYG